MSALHILQGIADERFGSCEFDEFPRTTNQTNVFSRLRLLKLFGDVRHESSVQEIVDDPAAYMIRHGVYAERLDGSILKGADMYKMFKKGSAPKDNYSRDESMKMEKVNETEYIVTDSSGYRTVKLKLHMNDTDIEKVCSIACRYSPPGSLVEMQADSHCAGNIFVGMVMVFDDKRIPISLVSNDIGCGLTLVPMVDVSGSQLHLNGIEDLDKFKVNALRAARTSLKRGKVSETVTTVCEYMYDASSFYETGELGTWLTDMKDVLFRVGLWREASKDKDGPYMDLDEDQHTCLKYIGRYAQTLGSSGNHFLEVAEDDNGYIWTVIHSGSRKLGAMIYTSISNACRILNDGDDVATGDIALLYTKAYHCLDKFARMNRCACAIAVMKSLGLESDGAKLANTLKNSWIFKDADHGDCSKKLLHGLTHNGIKTFVNHESRLKVNVLTKGANIDIAADAASIQPIGVSGASFVGSYDGGEFTISNWSYTDPNANTGTCATYVGLFGNTTNWVTIKNIRMSGVWTLTGYDASGGFLGGYLENTAVSNIECDLSPGSFIDPTGTGSLLTTGGLVGTFSGGSGTGLTLQGELDIRNQTNFTAASVGGMVGQANYGTHNLFRNLATFPLGLNGGNTNVGGILGYGLYCSSIQKFMNAMTGNITGTRYVGGVIGQLRNNNSSQLTDVIVNSMTGNITTTGFAGGVIGYLNHTRSLNTYFLNYMSGNITHATGSINACGGIIGYCGADPNVQKGMNAMKGYVDRVIMASNSITSSSIYINYDTSFGLTYSEIGSGSTTNGFSGTTDANYFNLPYAILDGTDASGVTYLWEFVYGNSTTLDLYPRPTSIKAVFGADGEAISYKLTVQEEGGVEKTVETDLTVFERVVKSLAPETTYTVKVYSTLDGTTYDSFLESTTTTTENLATNYSVSDFANDSGKYDVSEFNEDSKKLFYSVANDLFSSGESIVLSVGGKTKTSTFVKRGETASIQDADALFLPFDSDSGSSQSASMTLSDNSTVTLTYDEEQGTIDMGGVVFSAGDHTIIDGKKASFVDV
ncbi:unnamed protein product [Pylaiella littoralis]